jgi:hypothetical protein
LVRIKRKKETAVSGRAQNKSLRALKKRVANHINIENTAFNIYTIKFITVLAAIEIIEIIYKKYLPNKLT